MTIRKTNWTMMTYTHRSPGFILPLLPVPTAVVTGARRRENRRGGRCVLTMAPVGSAWPSALGYRRAPSRASQTAEATWMSPARCSSEHAERVSAISLWDCRLSGRSWQCNLSLLLSAVGVLLHACKRVQAAHRRRLPSLSQPATPRVGKHFQNG